MKTVVQNSEFDERRHQVPQTQVFDYFLEDLNAVFSTQPLYIQINGHIFRLRSRSKILNPLPGLKIFQIWNRAVESEGFSTWGGAEKILTTPTPGWPFARLLQLLVPIGTGRIFPGKGHQWNIFLKFPRRAKKWWNLVFLLETKKTNFFAEIFKIQGDWPPFRRPCLCHKRA